MRARPRTWPSMRLSRFSVDALLFFLPSLAMPSIYPLGVWKARPMNETGHLDNHGSVTDPVCGMTVDPHTAKHRADYRGYPYYFCSAGCKIKFTADPQKYLGTRVPEPAVEGAIYTCPMHPQIRLDSPGACPICGMALEPEMPSADTGPNPELTDMTRRFWIGLVLALPVMIVDMGGHFAGPHNWIDPAL